MKVRIKGPDNGIMSIRLGEVEVANLTKDDVGRDGLRAIKEVVESIAAVVDWKVVYK